MREMRLVEKSEFDAFIDNYPRKLDNHVVNYVDPPVKTYDDFSDGAEWPESTVAWIRLKEGDSRYPDAQNEFRILRTV